MLASVGNFFDVNMVSVRVSSHLVTYHQFGYFGSLGKMWCSYILFLFHFVNTVQGEHWRANWGNKFRQWWSLECKLWLNKPHMFPVKKYYILVCLLLWALTEMIVKPAVIDRHNNVWCDLLWLSLNHLVPKTSSRVIQGLPCHGINSETKCSI